MSQQEGDTARQLSTRVGAMKILQRMLEATLLKSIFKDVGT